MEQWYNLGNIYAVFRQGVNTCQNTHEFCCGESVEENKLQHIDKLPRHPA
jgi:hypothetical protein